MNKKEFYVRCELTEVVEIAELKAKFDAEVAGLDNSSILLLKYVDELIETINELESTQRKIKECDEFIQKYAARKKAYIATDYFKE